MYFRQMVLSSYIFRTVTISSILRILSGLDTQVPTIVPSLPLGEINGQLPVESVLPVGSVGSVESDLPVGSVWQSSLQGWQ